MTKLFVNIIIINVIIVVVVVALYGHENESPTLRDKHILKLL
jgi:hypothetical protein